MCAFVGRKGRYHRSSKFAVMFIRKRKCWFWIVTGKGAGISSISWSTLKNNSKYALRESHLICFQVPLHLNTLCLFCNIYLSFIRICDLYRYCTLYSYICVNIFLLILYRCVYIFSPYAQSDILSKQKNRTKTDGIGMDKWKDCVYITLIVQ